MVTTQVLWAVPDWGVNHAPTGLKIRDIRRADGRDSGGREGRGRTNGEAGVGMMLNGLVNPPQRNREMK